MDVRICVPWIPDGGHRDQLWNYCRRRWLQLDLGWPIVTGFNDDEPLNRSRARNAAARGDWDVAVFSDADNLPGTAEQVRLAVEQAAHHHTQVFAHDLRLGLNEPLTTRLLAGQIDLPDQAPEMDYNTYSGVWAISRQLWDRLGGFDERFTGWGFEDLCFMYAAETISGTRRVPGTLYHLWHPRDRALQEESPTYHANEALWHQYLTAVHNPPEMQRILVEAQQ